jgi:uncharacterized protein (DUF58 family)
VLTRQGWMLAWGGVGMIVIARLVGLAELYVFGAAALLLLLLAVLAVRLSRLHLQIDRRVHPAQVHAGSPSRVEIRVRNLHTRPTPLLRLSDPISDREGADLFVPPLGWHVSAAASYQLPTQRRGLLKVGPLHVTVSDPFGLSHSSTAGAEAVEVVVYPWVDPIPPVPFTVGHDPLAGSLQLHELGRAGDDFYALRPYVVGDDLRQIHWPSTARHDELLVRQQEQSWQGRTTVMLDLRKPTHDPETVEVAVSAAASVLSANSRRNDLVRLLTTDGFDSGYATGRSHIDPLLEHLAVVRARSTAKLGNLVDILQRGSGGAVVVIVAHVPDGEIDALSRLGRRCGSLTIVKVDRVTPRYWVAARQRLTGQAKSSNGNGSGATTNGSGSAVNGSGAAVNGSRVPSATVNGVPVVRVSDELPFAAAWTAVMQPRQRGRSTAAPRGRR